MKTTDKNFDEFLINLYTETAKITKIKLDVEEKETKSEKKYISDAEWERMQAEEERKFEEIWNYDFNIEFAETRGRKAKKISINGNIYSNRDEAAKSLNISVKTIQRMLKDGRANYISK